MKLVRLEVGTMGNNVYLVINDTTNEAVLIDCGGGGKEIRLEIERRGLSLKAILLTHGHADHINGLEMIYKTFSCPVYLHALEKDFLFRSDYNLSTMLFGHHFITTVQPELLQDGDRVEEAGFSFEVIHTPGHTPGGVCYRLGNVVFTGDTLFADSIGAELPPFGNSSEEIESIRNRLFTLPGTCICYPGHGEKTTVEYERKNNMYCRI